MFSNFAIGNVDFSTFEAIWLILTLYRMFNDEIWTISQQNIYLCKIYFASKLISCSRILGQKVYPGKRHIPGCPNIASNLPPWDFLHVETHVFDNEVRLTYVGHHWDRY